MSREAKVELGLWVVVVVSFIIALCSLGGCGTNQPILGCPCSTEMVDLQVLNSCGIITDGYEHGSVVMVSADVAITAAHCLNRREQWLCIRGHRYSILEEWISEKYDIGFIQIKGSLPYIKFGHMPKLLNIAYVVGSPTDMAFINTISKGVITKLDLDWQEWEDVFMCDAMSAPGNSGGAVLNETGELIGILVAGPPGYDDMSVCEPIEHIVLSWKEYIESE